MMYGDGYKWIVIDYFSVLIKSDEIKSFIIFGLRLILFI